MTLYDVFVGNIAFGTTEDQLYELFRRVGPVVNIRLQVDKDTGRHRGVAFVDFNDPYVALSAIKKLNKIDFNQRELRVTYSNNNRLRAFASEIGVDPHEETAPDPAEAAANEIEEAAEDDSVTRMATVSAAVAVLTPSQRFDVMSQLKEMAVNDRENARRLFAMYPELVEATYELMDSLGCSILTSSSSSGGRSSMAGIDNNNNDDVDVPLPSGPVMSNDPRIRLKR